ASLPGCSTTACPPSWNAPSSKLVRVRMDGLKNTRAIDLPFRSSPSLCCLNNAAWVSNASSSARLQSWVFKKCFKDIDLSFAAGKSVVAGGRCADAPFIALETFRGSETKKPSLGWVFRTDSTKLRLPSEIVGFRSAGTRRHAGSHPGGADAKLGAVRFHRTNSRMRMETMQVSRRSISAIIRVFPAQ